MQRALALSILLLVGLALGVDSGEVEPAASPDTSAQVVTASAPENAAELETLESTEPDSCEAEPPVLAQYDPGPVELPGPVVAAPAPRAFAQCTETPPAASAT